MVLHDLEKRREEAAWNADRRLEDHDHDYQHFADMVKYTRIYNALG